MQIKDYESAWEDVNNLIKSLQENITKKEAELKKWTELRDNPTLFIRFVEHRRVNDARTFKE